MTIIVPAIGSRYAKYAECLVASARVWEWDVEFVVVSDQRRSGWVFERSLHQFGKDVKTGFASYLPPGDDAVMLLDADMLAVGQFGWDAHDTPAGVNLGANFCRGNSFGHATQSGFYTDSCLLFFPTKASAEDLSLRWNAQWVAAGRPRSDVPALNHVAQDLFISPIIRDRQAPLPCIIHYLANRLP